MDNRYKQGKIYKLICSETLNIYYGSTIQPLKRRLKNHKLETNSCESKNFVEPIIELVEDYACNNELELRKREQYYIDNNECINKIRAYRTEEQRIKQKKECDKEYNEKHKERLTKQKKEYREKNKEKKNETDRKYYLDNKQKIAERMKEKIKCECGMEITRPNLIRHKKGKRHLDSMNS